MIQFLARKLTKLGGASYGLTLQIGVVRFGWQEGQNLQLTTREKNKCIVTRDWEG